MLLVASSLCGKWTEDSTLALERVHTEPANDSEGYYKLLGISPDADDGEVRSAGRRLMKMTHPDNGGDQREFEMVVRAYRTLSNPLKRREYNNTRPGPKLAVRISGSGTASRCGIRSLRTCSRRMMLILSESGTGCCSMQRMGSGSP